MAAPEIMLVDKAKITELKDELYRLMKKALDITVENKFDKIREAQDAFHEAKSLYKALWKMDLLNDFSVTQEDIDRIDRKQLSILEEKRRIDRPKWRS